MISGHVCQQATLLGNGKVLIIGGSGANGQVPDGELYNPATGTFAPAGTYASDVSGYNTCQGAVSTLLADGRVLIVWEEDAAEIYDPDAGSFTATGKPLVQSFNDGLPISALLMNGRILVAGGANDGGTPASTSGGIVRFRGRNLHSHWKMITSHALGKATLLPDGTVLLAGAFVPRCSGQCRAL